MLTITPPKRFRSDLTGWFYFNKLKVSIFDKLYFLTYILYLPIFLEFHSVNNLKDISM